MTLWDFTCRAERLENGYYRVTLTGNVTGERRESVGYHPLWELIRLIGRKPKEQPMTKDLDRQTLSSHEAGAGGTVGAASPRSAPPVLLGSADEAVQP